MFRSLRVLAGLLIYAVCTLTAYAQAPPWAFAPDPAYEHRFIGDTGPATGMAQGYIYEMVYDSICHVSYMVTECARNGTFVNLEHWKDGRLVHAPAPYLTYNSRTSAFPISAGDTITLYRELRWYHPITKWQDTNTYYSPDTLEYILHLVRASDGAPIAQLDSTGILPRVTPGVPAIYGSRPIMALVRHIVALPPGVTDSAFIGVTVRANGSSEHHFTRLDHYTYGVSGSLEQAEFINYLSYFSGIYSKRSLDDLSQPGDKRFTLAVTGSNRDINIAWRVPVGEPGAVSVVIYDVTGELVFSLYTTSEGVGETRYRAERSGTYVIALLQNNRIVRTQKITIN